MPGQFRCNRCAKQMRADVKGDYCVSCRKYYKSIKPKAFTKSLQLRTTDPEKFIPKRIWKRRAQEGVILPTATRQLQFQDPVVAADFARQALIRREEFNSQHGPVKHWKMIEGKLIQVV